MSPDESAPAPSPDAAAGPAAPSPSPTAEPAQGPGARLNSLEDAFRTAPEALKGSERGRGAGGAPDGGASPEASGEAGGDRPPEPSKPGEQGEGRLSRRGAAARISEQQGEIDRLVEERERERARAAELEAGAAAQATAQAERARAALARVGDDREFADLSSRRMRGEVLSYEQDQRLDSMLAWREHAADLWEIAERAHKQAVVAGLADRVERHGLDRRLAFDAPLPELLDHAVSVTEARVRKEQADEIAELRAELRGHRTRGAAAAAPTVGGASAPGGVPVPPDGSPPSAFFEAAIRADQAARHHDDRRAPARNGRR